MTLSLPFTRANRMRALTVGVLALGILSVQVGRGTLAYFTTQASSTANTFTAGNLHFNIADNFATGDAGPTSVNSSISLANMKPGDSVYAPITISNIGSLDGQYGIDYSTSFDATGGGTDLTTHLQLAVVASGSGTGVAADCSNTSSQFTDTSLWAEQIKPALSNMVVASLASPNVIVNSAATTAPHIADGTYDSTDLAAPAFLPLDHTGATAFSSDMLCVRVTFPDGSAPSSLVLDDNALNATTAQSVNTTIVFTFNGQQRTHPVEFDQTAPPVPGTNF
jgi:predicted ribosomally synthesized peptide with SipW-like signal peptide